MLWWGENEMQVPGQGLRAEVDRLRAEGTVVATVVEAGVEAVV